MNRASTLAPAALTLALLPAIAGAGAFIIDPNRPTDSVMHVRGYPSGTPSNVGNLVVTVCLNPTATNQAEQPIENAVAEFNRLQGVGGNVTPGPGATDFESVMLHELGHCMGLDHNTLGPSEVGTSDFGNPQLYYTKARPGAGGFNTLAGVDGVRASRDDIRGDDHNLHWFRDGVNNPFADLPAVVDQSTYTVNLLELPIGHTYAEAATSHAPCNPQGGVANTAALPGRVPLTESVMFPVLCTANAVRKLTKDDVAQFRIARAGYNGLAGTSDDYTWTMQYVGRTTNCHIPISLVPDNQTGFAQCNIGYSLPGNGANDTVITSASLIARASVNWHFNQTDTTAGNTQRIFQNGFE